MSRDADAGDDCNVVMGKTQFKQSFMGRVKQAREARGLNQEDMAMLLGMGQSKYHKYESRSYLPHDLVPQFCVAAGIDMHWLFTGRRRRADPPETSMAPSKPAAAPRRRKSA